jgi:hypothetical protein
LIKGIKAGNGSSAEIKVKNKGVAYNENANQQTGDDRYDHYKDRL